MERTLKEDRTLISRPGDGGRVRATPSNPLTRYAGAEVDFAPSFFAPCHSKARDDLLAFLLIHTWTLITGRELRSDVPPMELSEEELITFWADDQFALADSPAFARTVTGLTGRDGGRPVPPDA
jgi:hypothetical protein